MNSFVFAQVFIGSALRDFDDLSQDVKLDVKTLPRVLGPTETIKIPVTVFAMENTIKNVNVTLQTNPFLEITGTSSQVVNFTQPGEQIIYFDVKVKPNVGIGKVKIVYAGCRH